MIMAASQSLVLEPKAWASLLNEPSEKSSQLLLSPWSLSIVCALLACDQALLSLAQDPALGLQTQQTPMGHTHATPLGEEGGSHWFCHLLGP